MEQTSPSIETLREHKISFEKADLIELERNFHAPIEWLWKAWSDAELIKQWWGPKGYTSPKVNLDFRMGGKYLFAMRAPYGRVIWITGLFEEIIPNKKIVYIYQFCNEAGQPVSAEDIGLMGNWAKKLYVTIEFEPIERDKTKMVAFHEGIPNEMHAVWAEGWNESIDKLQELVERFGNENLSST